MFFIYACRYDASNKSALSASVVSNLTNVRDYLHASRSVPATEASFGGNKMPNTKPRPQEETKENNNNNDKNNNNNNENNDDDDNDDDDDGGQ